MTSLPRSHQPSLKNLPAWANERFPLQNFVLFVVVAFAFGILGRDLAVFSLNDVALFASISSFFLLVRILDEHKDYEVDLKNHPDRVLQSGKISLDQLKLVGVVTFLIPLGYSLYQSQTNSYVLPLFGVTMAWLGLMTKEFFLGEWLEERLPLYALSHMLIMPLAALWWLALAQSPDSTWVPFANPTFDLAVMAFAFFGSAAGEVVRKARGRDEDPNLASYSAFFGFKGTSLLVRVLSGLTVLMTMMIVHSLTGLNGTFILLATPLLVTLGLQATHLARYASNPTEKSREKNEGLFALMLLACYGIIIATYFLERG